jgi:hypothetical protein
MRLVGEGDACVRFEATCEALAELTAGLAARGETSGPSGEQQRTVREHAAACPACAGALRAAETLRRTEAFDVPEPEPSYWPRFSERLAERIREAEGASRTPSRASTLRSRMALAVAASVVLAAGALAVREMRRTAAPTPSEAELLETIGNSPDDRVAESLDEVAPPEIDAVPEDLAEAESLLGDDPGTLSEDDSPYDLFFDLGEEDRARLIKEMRGDIG